MRFLVLFAALHLVAPVALAAGGDAPDVAMDEPLIDLEGELGPPGPPPASEAELDELTRQINRGLRCPVCQGSSIQDSPVDSAVAMRARVRELAERGYDKGQIEAYFVTRYGEWILQAPAAGDNWMVWVCPSLGGALALAILAGVAARWRREPDEVPMPSETGDAPLDRYEQRLLDEIDR